jgi:uncharacterized protein YecT (DUF1311 family)
MKIISPRLSRPAGFGLSLVLLCAAASAQSQLEMNQSASKSFEAANAELSKAIEVYRVRLPEAQRTLFDQSQRVWKEYRRAACEFESSGVSGGTVYPMVLAARFETFTEERPKIIQQLSQCEEGDLSRPAANKE